MKKNLPITRNEIFVTESDELITTTDLKGVITFANNTFLRIAQFDESEMIGMSHNIVRHPDVPSPVFKDLWDRIKKGEAWRGVVKNRAKSGDFYWVDAYVTPIFKHGTVCGYESVRKKATREQISRAEKLYLNLNEGKGLPNKPFINLSLPNVLSLSVVISFLPIIAAVAADEIEVLSLSLAIFASFGLGVGFTRWFTRHYTSLVQSTKKIVDNPITQYLYTGRYDDSGQLQFASEMLETKINTILSRVKF